MNATIEGNELVIRLPIQNPPILSSSGKNLVVASTRGNMKSSATVEGKPITIGVNAYIAKD